MNERVVLCILCLVMAMPAGCRVHDPDTVYAESARVESMGTEPGARPAEPDETAKELRELLEERRRETPPPPAQTISFSFINTPLSAAAREISQLTGRGVSVMSGGTSLANRRVSLAMSNVEPAAALDWIARQADGIYTINDRAICIASSPDDLYVDDLVQRIYPLRTMRLYRRPVEALADMKAERMGIYQCVKVCLADYLERRPDASLALTPSDSFIAKCSPQAQRRIAEVLHEISLNDELTPPLPELSDADLQGKLKQEVHCGFKDRPVVRIIAELGVQADTSIGVDVRDLARGVETTMTLDAGKTTLKAALDAIVQSCGLKGYRLEPGHGIWLHGARKLSYSGRLPWDGWLIRSYYVEPIVTRISLPRFIELVKQNVTPEQWGATLPAMMYAPSGRLIVFHDRSAHAELESCLSSLEGSAKRGAPDAKAPSSASPVTPP